MFSKTILLFVSCCFLLSCQKKAAPVLTDRKAALPQKVQQLYPPRADIPPDTLAGKQIYANRCGRCHGLPDVQEFNVKKWNEILPLMFPRANLNKEESLHVWAYIMSISDK